MCRNKRYLITKNAKFKRAKPPKYLYDFTLFVLMNEINVEGLTPQGDVCVYLCSDYYAIKRISKQYDGSVAFRVNARKMFKDGYKFYKTCSDKIWVVNQVPAKYIEPIKDRFDSTFEKKFRLDILTNNYIVSEISNLLNLDGIAYKYKTYFTKPMICDFLDCDVSDVDKLINKNAKELALYGYEILKGDKLAQFKYREKEFYSNSFVEFPESKEIFTVEALLDLAMLVNDNYIAKVVRVMISSVADDCESVKKGGATKYIGKIQDVYYDNASILNSDNFYFFDALRKYAAMGDFKFNYYPFMVAKRLLNKNDCISSLILSQMSDSYDFDYSILDEDEYGLIHEQVNIGFIIERQYKLNKRELNCWEINSIIKNPDKYLDYDELLSDEEFITDLMECVTNINQKLDKLEKSLYGQLSFEEYDSLRSQDS